jgi:predicted XRE-type DNA-binding protein
MANRQRILDELSAHEDFIRSHPGEIASVVGISDSRMSSLVARQSISDLSDDELEKVWDYVQKHDRR